MKVVCIKTDPRRDTIEGVIYDVIQETICLCGAKKYDVGLSVNESIGSQCKCGALRIGDVLWCNASRFRPLDDVLEEISIESLKEVEV